MVTAQRFHLLVIALMTVTAFLHNLSAEQGEPLTIGIDADLSGQTAETGRAITRGCELAIAEINQAGGLLGRQLQVKGMDHRGNPARGIDNLTELAENPNLLAVVGGVHTPVALAELPTIHERKMLYLGPWAAGTPVVDNGFTPNRVFRVSVRDEFAGARLVLEMRARGFSKPALFLERTGWGRSNHEAITRALEPHAIEPIAVEWVGWGTSNLETAVANAKVVGADCIILVANTGEGLTTINAVMTLDTPLPILSHWGIAAGGSEFAKKIKPALQQGLDLTVLTTVDLRPDAQRPQAKALAKAYLERYGSDDPDQPGVIISSPGVAHSYDLIQLLALAVERAGSTDADAIVSALENLPPYAGSVRDYGPAFASDRHDALGPEDLHFAVFTAEGNLVPRQ
jgi:branched-chain amino acid transport system substrate-binding protein